MYSDTALQKNVIDELAWDPALTAAEIGVATARPKPSDS